MSGELLALFLRAPSWARALIVLAAAGPTGLRRDPEEIERRLAEEFAELEAALEARDPIAVAEEAGDAAYYATLLAVNTGRPVPLPMMVLASRGVDVMRAVTDVLAEYLNRPPWTVSHYLSDIIRGVAEAKFFTRFMVNGRVKNHEAEHEAVRLALGAWKYTETEEAV